MGASVQGRAEEGLRPLGEGGAAPRGRGEREVGHGEAHPEDAGRARLQTQGELKIREDQIREAGAKGGEAKRETGPPGRRRLVHHGRVRTAGGPH